MLHTDIPTEQEFRGLDAVRGDICVSIYLPTTPVTREARGDRILFKNLAIEAINQLKAAKIENRKVSAIEAMLAELQDDPLFWAYVAEGLAVFATPEEMRTFRLPITFSETVEVSDRFHVKPLVALLAFPASCFVLALSQGATRFIEVTPSLAELVKVDDLPKSMADLGKGLPPRDQGRMARVVGTETMQKALLGQYCRSVDRALRPILTGRAVPLILAAVEELAATYRAHNSYPYLVRPIIAGNPEKMTERTLAEKAREITVRRARIVIRDRLNDVTERADKDLASADLVQIAYAAVRGQVATLLVDVAASRPGTINPQTGKVKMATAASAKTYDLVDELIGLTVRSGGEVLPIKSTALPNGSPVAAIFRYRG